MRRSFGNDCPSNDPLPPAKNAVQTPSVVVYTYGFGQPYKIEKVGTLGMLQS